MSGPCLVQVLDAESLAMNETDAINKRDGIVAVMVVGIKRVIESVDPAVQSRVTTERVPLRQGSSSVSMRRSTGLLGSHSQQNWDFH